MRFLFAVSMLALALPAQAEIVSREIDWEVDGVAMRGHFVHDDSMTARGGLVMVPNWMGVTDSALDKAKAIAGRGYAVLLADVYGADLRPANAQEAGQAARSMYENRPQLRARASAAVEQLKAQPEASAFAEGKIGAIGFCFGGATVLELARSGRDDIAGVVSFHGSLATSMPAKAGEVGAGVLVLNGAADTYVSAEEIAGLQKEMTEAGADWQFVNFADAVHCFAEADANSPGCQYHERSAKRAYRMMDAFFAEVF
ncbi:MAG: dienelactone hydrolase family protein [Lysobacterales bacterium]|jgi:dienelactone hydrolase